MRTIIKILMLLVTLAFIGLNVVSFMASSQVVKHSTAENDPDIVKKFSDSKSKLEKIIKERSLVERTNPETFVAELADANGKTDAEATSLQQEVNDLAKKATEQTMSTAGAVTGAGLFTGGILCVSTGIYGVVMLVLGVLYFVFKPNTATVKVQHLN
ncbi:MAG: hypothetical protein U0638_05070 [Phycisphaerales bacterium]